MRAVTAAVLALLLVSWPATAQARRIDWWKVAGIGLLAVGGGFLVVGLGHQIGGRVASGDLLADDLAGRLGTAERHEAERRVRSLENGALLGYGVGSGLALAGALVLLLRPGTTAGRAPAATGTSPSAASGLLAPQLGSVHDYLPGRLLLSAFDPIPVRLTAWRPWVTPGSPEERNR